MQIYPSILYEVQSAAASQKASSYSLNFQPGIISCYLSRYTSVGFTGCQSMMRNFRANTWNQTMTEEKKTCLLVGVHLM